MNEYDQPVAWAKRSAKGNIIDLLNEPNDGYEPFYTRPARWSGLTDEGIALIVGECAASAHRQDDFSFARNIEAALKEKNAYGEA